LVVEEGNNATSVTEVALNVLNKTKNKFFLWLHYFQVHFPYYPPKPYNEIFDIKNYSGGVEGYESELTKYHYMEDITDVEIKHIISMYDGDVKFVDDQIKTLIYFLKNKGIYNNTIIVITSDHGEQLGEKVKNVSLFGHHLNLHLHEIKVPLIIIGPKIPRGCTFEEPVESVDILPTILGLLDIPIDNDVEGKNLLPYLSKNDSLLAFSNFWLRPSFNFNFDIESVLLHLVSYNESSMEDRYELRVYNIKNQEEIDDLLDFINLSSEVHYENYDKNIFFFACNNEYYVIALFVKKGLNDSKEEVSKIIQSISCGKENQLKDLPNDYVIFKFQNFSIIYPRSMRKLYPHLPHTNSMITKRYQLIETYYGNYNVYDLLNNYSVVSGKKIREDLIKKFLKNSNKRFKPEDYFDYYENRHINSNDEAIKKLRALGYIA
jgi:hypothetical protein